MSIAAVQVTPPPKETELTAHEAQVFGAHARLHPISRLPLELGAGALSADEQFLRQHLPTIRRERGDAAAKAMFAKFQATQTAPLRIISGSTRGGGA
jgi:hypothetical protein